MCQEMENALFCTNKSRDHPPREHQSPLPAPETAGTAHIKCGALSSFGALRRAGRERCGAGGNADPAGAAWVLPSPGRDKGFAAVPGGCHNAKRSRIELNEGARSPRAGRCCSGLRRRNAARATPGARPFGARRLLQPDLKSTGAAHGRRLNSLRKCRLSR